jgi:hypothetical protein
VAPKIPKQVKPPFAQLRRIPPVYLSFHARAHSFLCGYSSTSWTGLHVGFPLKANSDRGEGESRDEILTVKIAPFFSLSESSIWRQACAFPFSVQISLTGHSKNSTRDALAFILRSARLRIRHVFTAPRFCSIQVLTFPGVCDSAPPNLALNRLLAWVEPAITKPSFRT